MSGNSSPSTCTGKAVATSAIASARRCAARSSDVREMISLGRLTAAAHRPGTPQFEAAVEWVDAKHETCALLSPRDTVGCDGRTATEFADGDDDLVACQPFSIVDCLGNHRLLRQPPACRFFALHCVLHDLTMIPMRLRPKTRRLHRRRIHRDHGRRRTHHATNS